MPLCVKRFDSLFFIRGTYIQLFMCAQMFFFFWVSSLVIYLVFYFFFVLYIRLCLGIKNAIVFSFLSLSLSFVSLFRLSFGQWIIIILCGYLYKIMQKKKKKIRFADYNDDKSVDVVEIL